MELKVNRIDTRKAVSEVVASFLMQVYESRGNVPRHVLAKRVGFVTGYERSDVASVMDGLYDEKTQYLRDSVRNGGVEFGVLGYWALENAFMHGEDSFDDFEILEAYLAKDGVFGRLNLPLA